MAMTAAPPSDLVAPAAGRALLVGTGAGLLLGTWCRMAISAPAGTISSVLADLGAPWVVAAFVVGALVARPRPGFPATEAIGVLLGGIAGSTAMVLASFTYYGAPSDRAVLWSGIGVVVGGAAALAGAAWRTWPGRGIGAWAAAVLGLVVAAEALARLTGGLQMTAGAVPDLVALTLLVVGMAAPVFLTRGRTAGVLASLTTALLVLPTATAIALLATGTHA